MKFGLYAVPDTNMMIRCIDGHFDLVLANPALTTEGIWRNILTGPSRPCDQNVVLNKLASCGSLCTYCRSVAKTLYGVPDDVDLYKPGDFGVTL